MKNSKNKPIKIVLIYNIISLTIFIMALAGWKEGDFWDKINNFLGTSILQIICMLVTAVCVLIVVLFAPFSFYITKNIFLYMCIVYINALLSKLALDGWEFYGSKIFYDSYVLLQMKVNGIVMLIGITGGYIWRRLPD